MNLNMNKINILVVDDNEINQDLVTAYLNKYPIKLYYSSNGLEAINFVESFPDTDIVMMDLNMPVLNGFEALHAIKKKLPFLPVIAVTAFPSKYERDDAIYAGFDAYLDKPLDKELLLSVIASFLPDEQRRLFIKADR
ncbi:MAG: response regulator [Bacteroidota bacterium]